MSELVKRIADEVWGKTSDPVARWSVDLYLDDLARFAAAVRREALEDVAPLLERAMDAIPDYMDGRNDALCNEIDALLTSLQSPPSPEGTSDTGTR